MNIYERGSMAMNLFYRAPCLVLELVDSVFVPAAVSARFPNCLAQHRLRCSFFISARVGVLAVLRIVLINQIQRLIHRYCTKTP
ncbi:hypothetical protein F5I97DRAFT_1902731 [Phlebopus sp. FC_14]|nr:hypothetical protein F5I97DRAFT_1902731 [Phlebopus sp. FC_14]